MPPVRLPEPHTRVRRREVGGFCPGRRYTLLPMAFPGGGQLGRSECQEGPRTHLPALPALSGAFSAPVTLPGRRREAPRPPPASAGRAWVRGCQPALLPSVTALTSRRGARRSGSRWRLVSWHMAPCSGDRSGPGLSPWLAVPGAGGWPAEPLLFTAGLWARPGAHHRPLALGRLPEVGPRKPAFIPPF